MIAIVGAGLTGLSTAYHLKKRSYKIFEQQNTAGGLCRSTYVDGFTFDFTGHLLHIQNPYTHRFIKKIAPGTFKKNIRKSAVYCRGRYVPYPFQANLYGLPQEIVYECLMGFIKTHLRKKRSQSNVGFKKWVLETFGEGIAQYFFFPYNEKLWQMDLQKLTSQWASWSIPRPTLPEVVQGALGIQNTGMGYNASFFYPTKGGIGVLADALVKKVKNIKLGTALASVNLAKKILCLQDGQKISYEKLVSTIPLPQLLTKIEDLPPAYKKICTKLRFVSVHNLNIGVNRQQVSPYHWIYFPEPEFPFYRVGFYSNFSPHMAPRKTSSLYIEISAAGSSETSPETLLAVSLDGLERCGIIKKDDRIVAHNYTNIEHAYVVFDKYRQKNLPGILKFLKKHSVFSVGRFGAWEYESMEDALLQGRATAKELI